MFWLDVIEDLQSPDLAIYLKTKNNCFISFSYSYILLQYFWTCVGQNILTFN